MNDTTPLAEGSCFWKHRWTKWVETSRGIITYKDNDAVVGTAITQERQCVRCSKKEVDIQKAVL